MTIAILDNEITRDSEYAQRMYAQIPLESNILLLKYFHFFSLITFRIYTVGI